MKKTLISTSVALVMGTAGVLATSTSQAALTTGSVLTFAPGGVICQYGGTDVSNCMPMGTDIGGSFFTMDANGDGTIQIGEKTPISVLNGIVIGTSQAASGSHPGTPGTSTIVENPNIDNPWNFFKNTGMHQTTSPVTVVSGFTSNVKQLDFSGWNVTWAGIPSINMGGGNQDCGTTDDGICIGGPTNAPIDFEGTFDNGTGLATMTCSTVSCSTSSTFTLTYAAVVPLGDPSGFGGVPYTLSLVGGHVGSAVPVPAAAWLFGSGLVGLVGVARRRKARV